jgi:NitT/TauT family transport system permease protein
VLLPAASPAIWAGLRIGMGRAILGVVIVELLLTAVGVGRLLQFFRSRFMAPELYATVLLLVAISITLIGVLQRIEGRLTPWSRVSTHTVEESTVVTLESGSVKE